MPFDSPLDERVLREILSLVVSNDAAGRATTALDRLAAEAVDGVLRLSFGGGSLIYPRVPLSEPG